MGKGLFSVYVDSSASTSSQPVIPRSKSHSKKLGLALQNNNIEAAGSHSDWKGKENFDPFAPTNMKDLLNSNLAGKKGKATLTGKVGAPAQKQKIVASCSSITNTTTTSLRSTSKSLPPTSSTNGICTGTLRTRVAPPLPPLSSTPETKSQRTHLLRLPERDEDVPLDGTPNSARDSGYDEGNLTDDREELSDQELNKRARALTESPLAEITGAYSPNGNFQLPSNNRATSQSTPTRPKSQLRTSPLRSSVIKEKIKKAPIAKPYEVSKTMTTRKRKPAVDGTNGVEGLSKDLQRVMRI